MSSRKPPSLTELDMKKLELQKRKTLLASKLHLCFVAADMASRATGLAKEIIEEKNVRGFWIVAPNRSGKTALGAREVAWHFLGNHPHKPRLPEWGTGPLFIIVAGRTNQLIEEELWTNKLKPLLPSDCYEITKRDKDGIKAIVNPKNGNRIMFISHNDALNARERIQGYTAHVVWLDEMPNDSSYVSELILRVSATGKVEPGMSLSGYFYATFTPLVENEEIKIIVDSCQFPFQKYVLRLEDNPIFAGWTSEQLDDMIRALCADQVEFEARRHGKWYYASERVFGGYEPGRNRRALPFPYHLGLQHALIVDPAASGKVGVSVAVLEPSTTDTWWVIESRKIEGAAASLLVDDIEREFVQKPGRWVSSDGRICDCAPSGFYKEANNVKKLSYRPYMEKNNKKKETIEETNRAFFNCKLMLLDSPATEALHLELLSAKWKANESEIQNHHKYHCADTIRYLWMKRPRPVKVEETYSSHLQYVKQEAKKEEAAREAAREKRNRLRVPLNSLTRGRRYVR